MNRLSEDERALGFDVSASMPGRWYAEEVVEAIVAARLASVQAFRDRLHAAALSGNRAAQQVGPELDAVLGSDAHTEQKETGR